MNRRLIVRLQGATLMLEAFLMLPAVFVSLFYRDGITGAFLITMGLLFILGFPLWFFSKPPSRNMHAREGLLSVSISWILLSLFGALPYLFSRVTPRFIDAWFESASGFTTTGATILEALDTVPKSLLFWRSFTLWVGGMGVLVLTLALLPQMTNRTSFLMRAESPGPGLSKLVPKMGDMAKILYLIYMSLTVLQTVALIIAGLSPFDALIHALGTAGTGGFSNYNANIGYFQNTAVEMITMMFMLLFSINFAVFYRIITGSPRDALRSEELHWFGGTLIFSIAVVFILITPLYHDWLTALRHSAFQVVSIFSTTGYTTQNFNDWHQGAKMILLFLMFIGACSGSTTGGLKLIRLATLVKIAHRETRHAFRPRKIQIVRFEGKAIDDQVLIYTLVFFFLYIAFTFIGAFLLSLESRYPFEFSLTAAISGISNGGVVFHGSGTPHDFTSYGFFSKLTLTALMLLGRLEIYPMLALIHPSIWKS